MYAKTETYSQTEVANLLGDRITLQGLTFTLQSYVSNAALTATLANNVTTDTEVYIKKADVFSNSIRLAWKESGDHNVLVPLLSTFQLLVARVDQLESQILSLETNHAATDQLVNTIDSTQTSIWAFTTNALQRITALEN